MTRFSSLLEPRPELSVGEQQRRAGEELPSLVRRSHLHFWQPGEPTPDSGRRILVGVASYSLSDLALLDALDDAARNSTALPRLDVFNILECRTPQDFDKYIPGIGKPFQSPVVGYWENGVLKEKGWGKTGRDLLARVLGVLL